MPSPSSAQSLRNTSTAAARAKSWFWWGRTRNGTDNEESDDESASWIDTEHAHPGRSPAPERVLAEGRNVAESHAPAKTEPGPEQSRHAQPRRSTKCRRYPECAPGCQADRRRQRA